MMRMRALVSGLMVLMACPGDDGTAGDGSASSTSQPTGMNTDGACGDVQLPPCDYCPASMATLCGLPCDPPGQQCTDELGEGMECVDGLWECVTQPAPAEDCTQVCVGAEACNELGCSDGLMISLVPDDDGITAGSYVVTIDADGAMESCDLEISDDPAVCMGGPPCVPDTTCNALVSISADEPAVSISLAIAAEVTVSVQRGAEPPVEVSEQPTYAVQAPNGPGCEPACASALVEVAAL